MKELVIISGKGGTGKTSLTAAFASLDGNKVICDADVDAADLHLITAPTKKRGMIFRVATQRSLKKIRVQHAACVRTCAGGMP